MTRLIEIRDDSIRLGQLLKLADFIDNGSEAKDLLMTGAVLVNGEVETRRGRQLIAGETVTVRGETVGIATRGP
ncbi:MAG TPA: RNA-binding S4 domain-containing protein [Marmoricola sp.]|jgi:ribosome-associated protein|nr:RNA-binding S4 domain-containing protein [Marmoricola sp.]